MADISITATSVIKGTGAVVKNGIAGASITAGQTLYIDTANSDVLKLAVGNGTTLQSTVEGIALHAAASGQPIAYQKGGALTLNAVLTAGKAYVASGTAGGIAPIADLTTGWKTSLLGIAGNTTSLQVQIINSGVTN